MGRRTPLFLLVLALMAFWTARAAAETLFADIRVNGRLVDQAAAFDRSGDRLSLDSERLKRLGLVVPYAAVARPVALSSLPGVRYVFDAPSQTVSIAADTTALASRRLDARPDDGVTPTAPAWGATATYAYYGLIADKRSSLSGLVEARVFGPLGSAGSSFALGGRGTKARRLETAFVRDDPIRARSLTVGDFVSTGPSWTRPVRAAGISLATNFQLRPDLITQPMPRIAGAAGAPSAVDVYFDNVRRYSTRTDPGPFSVDQLPMMDGRGQVSLVVTDVLGRQSVQSFPFYASGALLRRGLTAYAVEAGLLREDFAGPTDRYSDGFVSAAVRRGLSDRLTLEAQTTLSRQVSTAGIGLVANADEQALFAAAFSASSAQGRLRSQVTVSARRDTRLYGLFVAVQAGGAGYRDLAWRADAPPVQRAVQAGASVNTAWGAVSVSYNRLKSRAGDNDIVGLGWSQALGPVNFYASALSSKGASRATVFRLGFSLPIGRARNVGGSVQHAPGGTRASASVSSAIPDRPGWAWRALAEQGGSIGNHLEGELRRIEDWGEVALGASHDAGHTAGRLYGSGSVVLIDGGVHLARRVGDSFALIDAGAPDVGVTLENRPIGRTGRDGRLLAVQLPPFAASRIAVAPETVPLDHDILTEAIRVRPPRDRGIVVRLAVRPNAGTLVHIVNPDGSPAALGAEARYQGQAVVVGYDGLIYLDAYRPDTAIEIETPSGACIARTPHVDKAQGAAPRGPLVCRPADRPPDRDPERRVEQPGQRAELRR